MTRRHEDRRQATAYFTRLHERLSDRAPEYQRARERVAERRERAMAEINERGRPVAVTPEEETAEEEMRVATRKLRMWRTVFASRLLGTKLSGDPELVAVKDLFDKLLCLRVENSAFVALLVEKKIITQVEYARALAAEARLLDRDFEALFPGFKTDDHGLVIDPKLAAVTAKDWSK